tara:strand:- start:5071 stop:5358 length:288 start_codon:yes stop_codon:yes gene_type:complete
MTTSHKTAPKRAMLLGLSLGLSLGLAACAGDPTAEQARLDATDHQNCLDLGFKPDTEAYGNCRLKLREIRANQEADNQRSPGFNFGVGIGVSKGF